MGPIQRQVVKASMRSVRHPWTTLFIALAGLVACIWVSMGRLGISSDQNQLFSEKEIYFRDYIRFIGMFPENEAVYIVLQKRDPKAAVPVDRWVDATEAVVGKVRPLKQYVHRVEYQAPASKLGAVGLLFEEPDAVRRNRAEIDEFGKLLKTLGEGPNLLDVGFLGSAPTERFYRSMSMAPEKDLRRAAGLVAEISRSLQVTLASEKLIPPALDRVEGSPRELGYFYELDERDRKAVREGKLAEAEARHLLLIRVYEKRNFESLTAISETVDAIRNAARSAITPETFPEFTLALTGRPVLEADEMRISEHDTRMSEIIAGIAVFFGMILFLMPWSELRHAASWHHGIVIFLRGLWLALVAEMALGIGIGWTFGWATLTVGRLNLLSLVFVIALIGIGMDYLIQILTRYRREAQRYVRPTAIWARVFRYVSPPISTACLGAAGAFLVSILTPFQGAAELGIIAGGGLLLCLLAGYTVLPAILTLFPPGIRLKGLSERYATKPPAAGGWRLLFPIAWVVAVVCLIPQMRKVDFDPNLLNLQASGLESVEMVRHLETWYAVVLSEDLGTLRKVQDAVEKSSYVQRTDSLVKREDNAAFLADTAKKLPQIQWTDPVAIKEDRVAGLRGVLRGLIARFSRVDGADAQMAIERLAQLDALLGKTDPQAASARINAWQPAFLQVLREALSQFDPPPLKLGDLPGEVRDHYVYLGEAGHGGRGRIYALYIYPKEDLWDQAKLAAFVKDIERQARPLLTGEPGDGRKKADTRNFVLTGIAPELYHTTEAIRRSFFRATLYALGLIFVLVLLDLRSITQTLVAISVLALGLPMLMAIMGILSEYLTDHAYLVRFNLANFFGLPILIGAGHEYGVFMVHRYKEVLHNPRRIWRPWDVSDRALLLCAYVTSSAFAFLMLGRHRGMQSLGFVMAVGTACIYLATIFVVRPVLLWRLKRKGYLGGQDR